MVADPAVTDAVPTSVEPWLNCTVPAADGVTVEVNDTVAGAIPVVGFAAIVVVVAVAGGTVTTYAWAGDVEVAKVELVGVNVAV